MSNNILADRASQLTADAFEVFNEAFREITLRAERLFEEKDWVAGRRDASERMDLYERALDQVAGQLGEALGAKACEQPVWVAARARFASLVEGRYDIDRAETFFNSVTRKMLKTVGINRDVEFFFLHPKTAASQQESSIYRTYINDGDTPRLVGNILLGFPFRVGYERCERDAALVAQEIDLFLWPIVGRDLSYSVDVVRALFYRNKEAYIVGRIRAASAIVPLVIPLINGPTGVYADTVLLHESEISVLFSFAYSSFFVNVDRYDALITFLKSILRSADLAELYTGLGYNRHGKTEFYRELHRYVHVSKEQFVVAPGKEGAVMIVFTLPNYGSVFKVIKDRPCFLRSAHDTPKVVTNEQVRLQYDFVSHRDRAGRMVDTQEFENLRFKTKRFSEPLLREFSQAATNAVSITNDYIVLRHLYVQRRVLPLPLYFQNEKNPEAIRHVLLDFGYFLKDVASSGVFPCDLFNIWNYGVTPWGRVVLFDYDDVLPIERITFREKPLPRDEIEETWPEEDWIVATEEDFFMDELDRFSGIPKPLKGVFTSVHGDLYTLIFWKRLTEDLRRGEIFDVIPYDRGRRFHNRERTV
jgi:isocitrate dehydrogenase kinase/phosphatase